MISRTEQFAVHTYEVDAFGTVAVPALSGYLSEMAGLHAAELGVGRDALMARGLTWVLIRERIENPVPIVLGDTIEIETWPSGVERLAAVREFAVRRRGEVVARATTHWLVLDVATRKPVRPAQVLTARFPREAPPPAVPLSPGKLPELRAWDLQRRFHVRYSDIDANLHVTNTSYVAWAAEAAPRETWQSSRLAEVEVQFIAETRYGDAVLSRLAAAGDGAFAHAIVREEDGRELARLATRWVPRAAR